MARALLVGLVEPQAVTAASVLTALGLGVSHCPHLAGLNEAQYALALVDSRAVALRDPRWWWRDERSPPIGVLVLSRDPSESERVWCFDCGADDYVPTPCSATELRARAAAILRRLGRLAHAPRSLHIGEITIDPLGRVVRRAGQEIALTLREFDLLHHLARHAGQVCSHQELLSAMGPRTVGSASHNVNSHVNRLRAKLEPDRRRPRYVLTVRGVGYRLAEVC